jgi:hypothetical protein
VTLPNHRKKTVALDTQQIQQFLISIMKHRPAHLRLHAFALPAPIVSWSFGSPVAVSPSAEILIRIVALECAPRHTAEARCTPSPVMAHQRPNLIPLF